MSNTFIYNYFFQDEGGLNQYLKLEDFLYFVVDFWWQNRISLNTLEGKILYKPMVNVKNLNKLHLFCLGNEFKGYLFLDNIDDIKFIKRKFFDKSRFYLYCIEKDCELKGICNEPFMQLRNNYLKLEFLLDKYNFWEGEALLRKEDILLLKHSFEHFMETSGHFNVYPYRMKFIHNIDTLLFLDIAEKFVEEKNNERFIKNYENFIKILKKLFGPYADNSILEIYYKSVKKRGLVLGESINEIELLKEKIAEELKNEKSYEIRKYLILLNSQLDNYHAFLFKRYMILQKENNEVYTFIRTVQQGLSIQHGYLTAGIYGIMIFIFLISGQIFGFSNII